VIPDGIGALYVAYEQLKKKLNAEGLFNPQYKKSLPRFPSRIAVVTSRSGAALRDILRILKHRFPLCDVIVCPVLVQGAEAPKEIISALDYLNRHKLSDLIIAGRGGGSIEDLWAFNDEGVARAIFRSEIPVISAVGHEPDVTIADFVADLRAATPSNAAELATPDITDLKKQLQSLELRAIASVNSRIILLRQRLKTISDKKILKSPVAYFQDRRMFLSYNEQKLIVALKRIYSSKKEQYIKLSALLDAMSPLKVLSRGYSIASKVTGEIISRAEDVGIGETFLVKLSEGKLVCTADKRLEDKQ
jgi:exodeoxyribonuclease VII large subunit